jgi:hypothetical protein
MDTCSLSAALRPRTRLRSQPSSGFSGYRPYEATWAFWERNGFVHIDTIDPLPGWEPGNPAAIYVAALCPTR